MPFTPTLVLAIAPHKTPHFEGTGGPYFRLNKDTDDVALLTCAHITRPPPAFKNNTGKTWKEGTGQAREEIIALGTGAYENAVNAIMGFIGEQVNNIGVWEDAIKALPAKVDGEVHRISKKRDEYSELIEKAKKTIEKAISLHDEVTKKHTTADRRIIGYVLHSEKIEVNVSPHRHTKDWSLVELYGEVVDWANLKGNQINIGGNLTPTDWLDAMFPQPSDRKNYKYPPNGLLQARGLTPESEFCNPTNLDNVRTLLCVKYGRSTRGTFGRVNGLESPTRHFNEYGIHEDSIEIAVLGYYDVQSLKYNKFSDAGDSGAVVVGRDRRIIGIIVGGAGSIDETDLAYITPYHWLVKLLKEKYPDCFLYDIVDD